MRNILLCLILLCFFAYAIGQKPILGLPAGHSDAILSADFSPDGKYVLTGSKDLTAKFWTRDGRVLRTIPTHEKSVELVRFSPKGNYFITQDRLVTYLWSLYGEKLAEFRYNILADITKFILDRKLDFWYKTKEPSFSFSPDESSILLFETDSTAHLYFIDSGKSVNIPNTSMFGLSYSSDGQYILSQFGEEIILFNAKGEKIRTIIKGFRSRLKLPEGLNSPVIRFVPGQQAIAIGTNGNAILILDFEGNELASITPAPGAYQISILNLAHNGFFSPNPRFVFSNTGKYWNLQSSWKNRQWSALDYPNLEEENLKGSMVSKNPKFLSGYAYQDEYRLFRNNYNDHGVLTDQSGKVLFTVKDLVKRDPKEFNNPFMNYVSFPMIFAPDSNQVFVGYANGSGAIMDMEGNVIKFFDRGPLNKVLDLNIHPQKGEAYIFQYREEFVLGDSSIVRSALKSQVQIFDLLNEVVTGNETVDSVGVLELDQKWTSPLKTFTSFDGQYHLDGLEKPDDDYMYENSAILINENTGVITISNKKGEPISEIQLSDSVNDLFLTRDNKALFVCPSNSKTPLYILDFHKILEVYEGSIIRPGRRVPKPGTSLHHQWKQAWSCVLDTILSLPYRPYCLDYSEYSNRLLFTSHQKADFGWINLSDRSKRMFKGHRLQVKGARFIKNEEFVLSWSDDYSMKIWETATGKELATLFFVNESDYVITTPSGLFNATDGAKELMYYVVDLDIIDIEQLEERFFSRGLLGKVLGFSPLGLREVSGLDQIELYPKVEAEIENDTLRVVLMDQGGGIGKATIFLNGKERVEEANPLPLGGGARDSVLSIPLATYLKYVKGHPDSMNSITIRAYNEEGWLRSRPLTLDFASKVALSKGDIDPNEHWSGFAGTPDFYGVVIGTNEYSDERLKLNYADNDAAAMAVALEAISKGLYGQEGKVEITCLSTTPFDSLGLKGKSVNIPWKVSSKKNIKEVFEQIAQKAKPKDVLVVYFSGHGLSVGTGEKTQFYYLTKDLTSKGIEDPAILHLYSISSAEITHWMNAVPAAKGVVILDACNSGAALDAFNNTDSKNLNDGAFEAINRMKYRTGTFVIAGSAPDKLSYESKRYGQGLLTYALLKGMLNAFVTREKGRYVDVSSLFEYACNTVPKLAESIDGIQRPMIGGPQGSGSFDIGLITDKVKIPVRGQSHIFTRSIFIDSNSFQDELGLVQVLESRFKLESNKGLRADFIFMDAYSFNNAYSVSGIYSQEEGKIHLTAYLFQDKVKIKQFDLPPVKNVDLLSRLIVLEIKDYVNSQNTAN